MNPRHFSLLVAGVLITGVLQRSGYSQSGVDERELIRWINQIGGEFERDENRIDKPVIRLRIDIPRGTDLGFFRDLLNDPELQVVAMLSELEELSLERRGAFSDKGLVYLHPLVKLRSLNLSHTWIDGTGLKYLAPFRNLAELDLSGCVRLTDDSLRNLIRLKNLTGLRLDATPLSSTDDSTWAGHLWSAGTADSSRRAMLNQLRGGISDVGLQHVLQLENLRWLSIDKTRVTDAAVREIHQLDQLEYLDVSRTAITDESLEAISKLKHLRTLKMNFLEITDAGLGRLASMEQLEELELRGNSLRTPGFRALVNLKNLRRLDLSMTRAKADVLEVLASMPGLKEVSLRDMKFTFRELAQFADRHPEFDLPKVLQAAGKATTDTTGAVISLNLQEWQLDDRDLSFCKDLTQLEQIDVNGPDITDQALVHLRQLTRLRDLNLRGAAITFRGLYHLFVTEQQRPLGEVFNIAGLRRRWPDSSGHETQFLDLRHLSIDGDDLRVISEYEATSLFLNDNPIPDDGLLHLAGQEELGRLWLNGMQLTGKALANLGPNNIRELFLTDTSVAADDLSLLEKNFPHLQILNLCGTLKGDAGAQHLHGLRDLRVLIIDANALSQPAIASLRTAHPALSIVESQSSAIREIRGKRRTVDHMSQAADGSLQMGSVLTDFWKEHPLIPIYGDEYFEQVESLSCRYTVRAPHRWKDLQTLRVVNFYLISEMDNATDSLVDLPQLREVSFYRSMVQDDDLAALSSLRQLERLDLQRTPITDKGLIHISKLTGLRDLSLGDYGTNIGDDGLKHLADLTNLETLRLDRTNISDAGFVHLKKLKKLKSVSLREVRVDEGLEFLNGLGQLEYVDLSSTFLSDVTAKKFGRFPAMRRLSVGHTLLSEDGVNHLRQCAGDAVSDVKTLMSASTRRAIEPLVRLRATLYIDWTAEVYMVDLSGLADATAAIPALFELRDSLTDLRLGKHATDELLAELEQFPKLEAVNLSDSLVSSTGLSHLRDCQQLNTLVMQGCDIDDAGLAVIHDLKQLKTLALGGSSLPAGFSMKIARMTALQQLYLNRTSISDADMASLAKLPNLTRLALDRTNITASSLTHLKTRVHLRTLTLVGNGISETDLGELRAALPECEIVLHTAYLR